MVASKNLEIDTRNNVTVELLNWNGNVEHNSDGSLALNVSGEFTMSGTSLKGGSVNGDFQCVSIPRKSSFSLSKTSILPDEEILVKINSNSSSFSHKLILELGDFFDELIIPETTTECSFVVPKEWASALPKSKSGILIVTLKTYSGNKSIGSKKTQITFQIPETDDFLPAYNVYVTAKKNGLVPSNWNAVLQNRSTLTVKLNSAVCKYGANIQSSYIIVGNIKKYGIEAEFDLPDSGTIPIITHIEDSRGFVREKENIYDVCPYSSPTIDCKCLVRCDSTGAISENGTSALIDYTPIYSSVYGLNFVRCYVKYKRNDETAYSEPIQMTQTPFILNAEFQTNSSYDFVIYIKDAVSSEQFEIERSLTSGYVAFNIRKGGKGAAFGCYSENENELTIGYNVNIKGEIISKNLNSKINAGAGFSVESVDIKDFSPLSSVFLRVKMNAENNITSGSYVKLFSLTGETPVINTLLNAFTGNYEIDKYMEMLY